MATFAGVLLVVLVTACTSAPTPSATTPATVADMLPATLNGAALDAVPVDPSEGALGQLVLRVGKTSTDVDAAGRTVPGDDAGFVTAVRIAGVNGERLLDEHISIVRAATDRVDVATVSLGGKEVTRLNTPRAPEPMYLLLTGDTLITVGAASEEAATELLRQVP